MMGLKPWEVGNNLDIERPKRQCKAQREKGTKKKKEIL